MSFSITCPRCGQDFQGDDRDSVATEAVEHARSEHKHTLDVDVVRAHLEGVHPHDFEG